MLIFMLTGCGSINMMDSAPPESDVVEEESDKSKPEKEKWE
jgi:hypothetical protein